MKKEKTTEVSTKVTAEKPKKAKKPKHVRTPKESTALMLGCVSAGVALMGILVLLFVSSFVSLFIAIFAILLGFASLSVGKGGVLPALFGSGAGFLTVLSAIVMMRLSNS